MVVNGLELLRKIVDNEIKYNSKIKNIKTDAIYRYFDGTALWRIEPNGEYEEIRISTLITGEFEIIEDEEIDIQAIEEFILPTTYLDEEAETMYVRGKINELIKAVKQLDKKIKE